MRLIIIVALALVKLFNPFAAEAQQADKIARIGYLSLNVGAGDAGYGFREAFRQGLRDFGYVESRNLLIENRDAEGKLERFPALAAEMVALKVDVIVATGGAPGALAAKQATTIFPIVVPAVGDPVAEGLVNSLARPGGNVTGLSVFAPDLVGKSLELLTQTVPRVNRVALLLNPDALTDRAIKDRLRIADGAARVLGLRLQALEARGPQDSTAPSRK